MSKNPRKIKKKHSLLRVILLSTVASVNLPPPVNDQRDTLLVRSFTKLTNSSQNLSEFDILVKR